jgi:hypothetical protein
MNPRIKDFGKQAYDAGTGIWPINSKAWYEVYNTTFAKLIVRECAGIYGNLHMGTDNYLEALQKHFGVEE